MLQNKFERPLDLAIKPSKIFYRYLIVLFLCCLVSILITVSLPLLLRLFLCFLLLVGVLLTVRKNSSGLLSRITLNKDNDWEVLTQSNERYAVELSGECIVTRFLVWLNFSTRCEITPRKHFHVLLLSDSLQADEFRQLRVRLRFCGAKTKSSELEV